MPEKIITACLLLLVSLSAAFAHGDQLKRMEQARQEVARLDQAQVVGWYHLDPVTRQLVFVGRK